MRNAKLDAFMLEKGYLPVPDAADRAKTDRAKIYRLIREGVLDSPGGPGPKYVSLESLVRWLGPERSVLYGLTPPVGGG